MLETAKIMDKPLNAKIHLNLRVNEETKDNFEDTVLDIKKEHGKHIKVTDMFRGFVDKVIEDPTAVVEFLNIKSK